MAKAALITIHGMGVTQRGYENDLLEKLGPRLGKHYQDIDVQAVYYQSILQGNQQEVWDNVEAKGKVRYDDLRRFLLFGFGDAAGLETRKEYSNSVYELAQKEIANALLNTLAKHGPNVPLVFLTHSLGCQVLSSYLYDAQKYQRGEFASAGIWMQNNPFIATLSDEQRKFIQGWSSMAWITTGCNIPIFVAAHQRMNIVPIKKPHEQFIWLNIYDPDDVLSWPLQPLSDEYERLVEDRAINAGQGFLNFLTKSWNPLSHSAYWTDDDVVKPLAKMLRTLVS